MDHADHQEADMLLYREADWARQAEWKADYDRRFAARVELQRRLHEMDPERHSLLVPLDDPEFGTEAWTAAGPHETDPRA
jgi:hypothetical protein